MNRKPSNVQNSTEKQAAPDTARQLVNNEAAVPSFQSNNIFYTTLHVLNQQTVVMETQQALLSTTYK